MIKAVEKHTTITEATVHAPIAKVFVADDEVCTVNENSNWEIEKVLTDYTLNPESHEVLILVFKQKDSKKGVLINMDHDRWVSVKERLPEESGSYLVYLRAFGDDTHFGFTAKDLSYVTDMFFDKNQMLWVDDDESYNAILSAVNIDGAYHVTHWMPMPKSPKEG